MLKPRLRNKIKINFQFIFLLFFIIFLSISLLTLNSDFIALSIFCFSIFIIDYFYLLLLNSVKIKAISKIYKIENNQKINIKNNRFEDGDILLLETEIEIESSFYFFFNFIQNLPEKLEVSEDQFFEKSKQKEKNLIVENFFHIITKKSKNDKENEKEENKIKKAKKEKDTKKYKEKDKEKDKKIYIVKKYIKVKRGFYEFKSVEINIFSLLFLSSIRVNVDTELNFYATLKEPVDIELPIRSRKISIFAGSIPSKRSGVGIDFYGVRKYYEGDKLSLINWKKSAKNSDLYVNEFEKETNTDISIIVDCRKRVDYNENSKEFFEKALQVAYSIAKSLLKNQNRVSFLQFGSFFNYLRPAYGKIQLEKINQILSRLDLSVSQDYWELDNIPLEIIPAQSLVFLITPLEDEDIPHIIKFHKKKYRFVIIALDIVEYTYKNYDEQQRQKNKAAYLLASSLRKATIETARKTGAIVLNYDCIKPFNQFIKENNFYLYELVKRYGRI